MKKCTVVFLSMLLCTAALSAQVKKRVAVFTFEDKSSHSYHWWNGKAPGEGMADMLTTDLVKSGKYSVIERQQIDQLLQEQQLGASGVVTPQSAAEIGKMLGVDIAVIGAVTEFGYSKSSTGGRIKGIGLGVKNQKATVGIDVRFVNTSTGEILAADNVRKEKSKGGLRVSTPKLRFNNRNDFDNSLVGKVTREAINDIITMLDDQMGSIKWQGKIILVKNGTIYMKPGSDAGVSVGNEFVVYRKGEALIDPDTGLSLGSEEEKVGTIRVTGLVSGGKAAKAVAATGSGYKKDDIIRKK